MSSSAGMAVIYSLVFLGIAIWAIARPAKRRKKDDIRWCPNCGHAQLEGSFCEQCGKALPPAADGSTDAAAGISEQAGRAIGRLSSRSHEWVLVVGIISLVISFLLGAAYGRSYDYGGGDTALAVGATIMGAIGFWSVVIWYLADQSRKRTQRHAELLTALRRLELSLGESRESARTTPEEPQRETTRPEEAR